jgi:uncharacterized membrane-anchored protein
MMRGVPIDLASRGANASKTMAGPVALVRKEVIRRCERAASDPPAMAALLTRASMLACGQSGTCHGAYGCMVSVPAMFLLDLVRGFMDAFVGVDVDMHEVDGAG